MPMKAKRSDRPNNIPSSIYATQRTQSQSKLAWSISLYVVGSEKRAVERWVPQRLGDVGASVRVAGGDGGKHQLFVGVRAEVEANVDVVGERDERHLEAVRRQVGADRQRLDDGADQLHHALKVVARYAARRVHHEHDVDRCSVLAPYTHQPLMLSFALVLGCQ